MYCVVSWGSVQEEGRGPRAPVSPAPQLNAIPHCQAGRDAGAGRGALVWKRLELWLQGFPAHQEHPEGFTTVGITAKDLSEG